MSFEIDIGFASQAGRKEINEDFCAAMLPEPGQEQPSTLSILTTNYPTRAGTVLLSAVRLAQWRGFVRPRA